MLFYFSKSSSVKSEDTNSLRSNTLRSSIPSPIPMNFTGMWNWSDTPITTPPLAEPSSLVTASAVTSVALENSRAC